MIEVFYLALNIENKEVKFSQEQRTETNWIYLNYFFKVDAAKIIIYKLQVKKRKQKNLIMYPISKLIWGAISTCKMQKTTEKIYASIIWILLVQCKFDISFEFKKKTYIVMQLWYFVAGDLILMIEEHNLRFWTSQMKKISFFYTLAFLPGAH